MDNMVAAGAALAKYMKNVFNKILPAKIQNG